MSVQRTPPNYSSGPNMDSETDGASVTGKAVTFTQKPQKRRRPSHDEWREEMSAFKSEIKEILAKISNDVMEVKSQNSCIQQVNEEIKSAIEFLSAEYDEMKKKVELLEKNKKEQNEKIEFIEQRLEDFERISRLNKVEVRNLPEKPKETREDLTQAIVSISKKLNTNIGASKQSKRLPFPLACSNHCMC